MLKEFQNRVTEPDGVLTIGPVQWRVHLPEGRGLLCSDPAYDGFWRKEPAEGALVTMEVTVRHEARTIPDSDPLFWGGKNWALWDEGRDLIICSGFYEQDAARFMCRLNRNSNSAEIFVDPARDAFDELPLRYPMDQILSWGMLAGCGGLILHSAVAVKDGLSWVFVGRSGAGKTTLSELCFSKGWKILNDDRTMVFKRGDQVYAAGTPWHGSGRFAVAEEKPLGGIFVLEQALDNRMEAMSAEEIKYALLDVAAVPWFDDQWAQGALDAADGLMTSVPFYRFCFNREDEAVEALQTKAESLKCGKAETRKHGNTEKLKSGKAESLKCGNAEKLKHGKAEKLKN